MHICMITEYFPDSARGEVRGGVEARTFNLARELAKKHKVTVITSYEEGKLRTHMIGAIRVIRCCRHTYTHGGAIFSRLRFALGVRSALQTLLLDPPDIIEGENFICYLPAHALAKKLEAKAVATYHEVWLGDWVKNKGLLIGLFGEWWERMALRKKWDKIITVSEFTGKKLIRAGVPQKDIVVIPNGVDLEAYPTLPKYDKPTICCISRLTKTKHVDQLLLAVAKLKRKHPRLQVNIIGVGKEEQALRTAANELGIGEQVHFLGFVDRQKLVEVLAKSHLYCTASTLEGFGMALLEAMASGVPYVATRIPAHEEITQGKGGVLFKPGNVDDFAAKINFLLTRKEDYAKKSQEGKAHAQRYDWERIAAQVEEIYGEMHGKA